MRGRGGALRVTPSRFCVSTLCPAPTNWLCTNCPPYDRSVLSPPAAGAAHAPAGRLERAEFDRDWVRVEPCAADHSLIALSARGRSVNVGRYVRPELRPALAREIRMALRAA